MKSFIKTHRRIGSFGRDEKEKNTTGISSSTVSSPRQSLPNSEEEITNSSFELISTNNPNIYSNSNYSPKKSFNNFTNMNKSQKEPGATTTVTTEVSPIKSNIKTSAPQYSLTLDDISHPSENKLLKYSKNLFSRNKDDMEKMLCSSSMIGIRGSNTHNWDSTTKNSYIKPKSLGSDIASPLKFEKISKEPKSPKDICQTSSISTQTLNSLSSNTPISQTKNVIGPDKNNLNYNFVASGGSSIDRHNAKDTSDDAAPHIHFQVESPVNFSKESGQLKIKITDDRGETRNLNDEDVVMNQQKSSVYEENESIGSFTSRFSFEYDNLNQRNDSFRYYKTENDNTDHLKKKQEHVEDYYEDAYDNVKQDYSCDWEDDTEHLFNRQLFNNGGDRSERVISQYEDIIKEVNEYIDSDLEECDDNDVDCSANLLQSLTDLTLMKKVIEDEEPIKPLKILKFHNLNLPENFKEDTSFNAKYPWLDVEEENKDITNEYIDEVNNIPEDYEPNYFSTGNTSATSPPRRMSMFRSNSYPRNTASVADSNKIEFRDKVVTLFRSHSYNESVNKKIESHHINTNINGNNRNDTIIKQDEESYLNPKEKKSHDFLSPINESFEN